MSFELLQQIVQTIIHTIQTTAVQAVRALQSHTYDVTVSNPQTEVKVQGKVEVDQSGTQKQLRDVSFALRELKAALRPLKEVRVSNMLKPQPFPKLPEFPKKIEVSNMVKEVDFKVVVQALRTLDESISKLKLDPTIKVDAPTVNVPAPIVNVPEQKAPVVNVAAPDLSDLTSLIEYFNELSVSKPLPVRLSDGKKFYTALQKMADIYAGSSFSAFQTSDGSDGRGVLNRYNELRVTVNDTWDANDVDKVSDVLTYFGEETTDGAWRVRSVTKSGTVTSIRHATVRNNATITSYEEAWSTRASLDYGYAREL